MREWVERELARSDAEGAGVWRIAVMHHGPWSALPHAARTETAMVAARIPELLAAHKVDLVLAGHDHLYERGEGLLKYVITGGGGAPLYPARPVATTRHAESVHHFVRIEAGAGAMRMVATRVDGSVIEACGFARGAGWDCDGAGGGGK